jgi:hypothetical protein
MKIKIIITTYLLSGYYDRQKKFTEEVWRNWNLYIVGRNVKWFIRYGKQYGNFSIIKNITSI